MSERADPHRAESRQCAQLFGEYVALDGGHQTSRTHVLIANGLIGAINSVDGTTIPAIPEP